MRIERKLLDSVLKGNSSANERYLADTYVFAGPDGTVENNAQAISDLKSGDLKAPIRIARRCQGTGL